MRGRGEEKGGVRGRGEEDVDEAMGRGMRIANQQLRLDCAHLHVLMHHSSASLRHGAKHYIYFANANLC